MKKHLSIVSIVMLFTLLALTLGGCAKHYRSAQGVWLTYPRDSTATAFVDTLVTNVSGQPFHIEVQYVEIAGRENVRLEVPNNTSYIYRGKNYEMLWVKIIWFCSDCEGSIGHSKEELTFDYTFLYRGKPLIVDELFLRGLVLQEGHVQNNIALQILVWDNQGNYYVSRELDQRTQKPSTTLESNWLSADEKVIPGLVTFYWKITDPDYLERNPRERDRVYSDVRWIDSKRNARGPNGELTGWTFEVNPPGTEAKKQRALREAARLQR